MRPPRGDREFERWLEDELRRAVDSRRGPSPRAAQAAYRSTSRKGVRLALRSGIVAAIGAKGAAGLAVVALAVGGGGAIAVSATHSANPVTWGQQVIRAVQGCGDQAGRAAAGGSRPGVCAPVRVLGGSQEGRDDGRPGAKGSAGPTSSPSSDGQQGQHGNGPTTAPGRSRDRNQGGEPAPDSEKDKPRKKDVEASPSP